MQVRCLHCHKPIDVLEDASFAGMSCPSCGSSFSLFGDETVDYGEGSEGSTGFEVRTIGHFELIDQLGDGSFGNGWMARDICTRCCPTASGIR